MSHDASASAVRAAEGEDVTVTKIVDRVSRSEEEAQLKGAD
jgi:hypothetical protein